MLFQKSALLCLLRFFFVTFYKHRLYSHSNDGLGFHCVPDKAACRATQEARCSKLYMVLLLTATKWLPASAMLAAVLPLLPSVAHWGYAKSALSFFNPSPVLVPYFSSISFSLCPSGRIVTLSHFAVKLLNMVTCFVVEVFDSHI